MNMTLFSRTLFVRAAPFRLHQIADTLQVLHSDIVQQDQSQDDSYLDERRNRLVYADLAGDFNLFLEPELWGCEEKEFIAALRALSKFEMAFAIPDDNSESPFEYVLLINGEQEAVTIIEDDIFQENYISRNTELRKALRRIAIGPENSG